MYYFDNRTLMQFLDQKKKLKVFADDKWVDVSSSVDLNDEVTGIGYDVYGKPSYYDYRDITQIVVGNRTFSIDQLQSFMTGKNSEEKPKSKSEDEEEKSSKKEPDLSWFSPVYDLGHQLIRETQRRKLNGR